MVMCNDDVITINFSNYYWGYRRVQWWFTCLLGKYFLRQSFFVSHPFLMRKDISWWSVLVRYWAICHSFLLPLNCWFFHFCPICTFRIYCIEVPSIVPKLSRIPSFSLCGYCNLFTIEFLLTPGIYDDRMLIIENFL